MTAPTACQCEHADHETGAAHAYLAVAAGDARAHHVGAVCDDCANGHLAEYVIRWIAGWNMPGCLPEVAPEGFASHARAIAYLAAEVEQWADDDDADYSREVARLREATGAACVIVPTPGAGFVVWVELAEVTR